MKNQQNNVPIPTTFMDPQSEFMQISSSPSGAHPLAPAAATARYCTASRSQPLRGSRWLIALAATLVLALAPADARAANDNPPLKLTYQGFLTDANGVPIGSTAPVNQTVIFRIFDAATGGNLKWSSAQTVTVDKGAFSALLGEGAASSDGAQLFSADLTPIFTTAGAGASDRYLELVVNGTTISPRLQFLASPYAMLARRANELAGGSTISGTLGVTGAVTANTVGATGAITGGSVQVTGSVSGNGGSFGSGAISGGSLSVTGTVSGNTGSFSGAVSGSSASFTGNISAGSHSGNGTIPVGGIILWSGNNNTIPSGWAICNGQNGTPDLRDRFVVGAGNSYSFQNTGGQTQVKLTSGNLPSFSITYGDVVWSEINGSVDTGAVGHIGANGDDHDNNGYEISRTATFNGSANAFDVRPPYYALYYIMRTQ